MNLLDETKKRIKQLGVLPDDDCWCYLVDKEDLISLLIKTESVLILVEKLIKQEERLKK